MTDTLDAPAETPDDQPEEPSEEPSEEAQEETFIPSTANLKLETKKFALQTLLEKAAAVLPTRDIMPVLKNFQLEALDGRVRVIATDLELSILAQTEMVKVVIPGTAVFPGKRLMDLVREAEDGDLLLDVVDGRAHIAVARATWDLMLMDGSEYPPLPEMAEVELFDFDRGKFLGAISAVRYAAATETVRPNLMMIAIRKGVATACDGTRFQQADLGGNFPQDIEIPIKAVDDLVKLLRATEQNFLSIGQTDRQLIFKVAGDVFIANKLMVSFPDVENILLKPALANDQVLHVDRQEMLSAIKRVRVTADPETSAVVLSLDSNSMLVKSRDKFGNQAAEPLDVQWGGDSRDVAFNHVHLTDMLAAADVKSCEFKLGTDTKQRKSPILLNDEEGGKIGILNQLRIEFLQ